MNIRVTKTQVKKQNFASLLQVLSKCTNSIKLGAFLTFIATAFLCEFFCFVLFCFSFNINVYFPRHYSLTLFKFFKCDMHFTFNQQILAPSFIFLFLVMFRRLQCIWVSYSMDSLISQAPCSSTFLCLQSFLKIGSWIQRLDRRVLVTLSRIWMMFSFLRKHIMCVCLMLLTTTDIQSLMFWGLKNDDSTILFSELEYFNENFHSSTISFIVHIRKAR